MFRLSSLDPRVKLLMLVLLSTASLLLRTPAGVGIILGYTLLILLIGGVAPRQIWRQAHGIVKLILLLFLIQCLFRRSGVPILTISGFTLVFDEGLTAAALVSLRLLVVVSSALIVLTGEVRDYLLALSWCGLPDELVYMVLAALRFIPSLREEAAAVSSAFQMRGCDIVHAPWPKKARLYVSMLLPIISGALRRAETSALAMEARAFRGRPRRSHWRKLVFRPRDGIYLAAFLAVFTALLLLIIFLM